MSRQVHRSTRTTLRQSNNAQLRKLQHNGIHKPVRTLAYGLRINRRVKR